MRYLTLVKMFCSIMARPSIIRSAIIDPKKVPDLFTVSWIKNLPRSVARQVGFFFARLEIGHVTGAADLAADHSESTQHPMECGVWYNAPGPQTIDPGVKKSESLKDAIILLWGEITEGGFPSRAARCAALASVVFLSGCASSSFPCWYGHKAVTQHEAAQMKGLGMDVRCLGDK